MTDFPDQLPHGDIEEVCADVYFVRGQMQFQAPNAVVLLPRAMTIVREGGTLTLINTLRLDADGLQALDRLGTVGNIVRLGASHGRDDAFYSDRYGAPVWAPRGMTHARPVAAEKELAPGQEPIAQASVMVFESIADPEAVLCLQRDGGILVTCDCIQNMTGPDEFTDEASAAILEKGGFFRRANIGPAWRARLKPDASDYERLLALEFRHLLPAHGAMLRHDAHAAIRQTVAEAFAT